MIRLLLDAGFDPLEEVTPRGVPANDQFQNPLSMAANQGNPRWVPPAPRPAPSAPAGASPTCRLQHAAATRAACPPAPCRLLRA